MKLLSLVLGAALAVAVAPAFAANVDVQELNKGDEGAFVFQPDLVKIAVGDTVTFQPTDKGHDVDGAAGNIPATATPFKSALSQPLTQTFTVPGVYLVKCDPHYALGMVAVVVVGDDLSNLDAIKAIKNPGKAQQRLDEIFEHLKP
ncbi:MAG: pseudoazurin [Devosia sp.]|jgi:pseudoazurin